PEGRIYGVDLSKGKLCRARKLCHRRQWTNVVLIEADAAITQVKNCLMACFLVFPITSYRIIALYFVKFGNSFVRAADSLSWTRDSPKGSWESSFDHLRPG